MVADSSPLRGLRVLVVDDEVLPRQILAETLGDAGAEVTCVADPEEALRLVQTLRPDALLSDLRMPKLNGFELIRKVRALPAEDGGETPAAAITADISFENRGEAIKAGFQGMIGKRMERDHLIRVVLALARPAPTP